MKQGQEEVGFSALSTWSDLVRPSNCVLKPFTPEDSGALGCSEGCVTVVSGSLPPAAADSAWGELQAPLGRWL